MKTAIAISVVLFSAFASTSYGGEFNGQGMPRKTREACEKANAELASKIAKRGYLVVHTECVSTNEDVGEFVPTVNAVGNDSAKTDQIIGARHLSSSFCTAELAQAQEHVLSDDALEGECLEGEEYNELSGGTHKFYQAWITKFAATKTGSIDFPKTDQDGRYVKSATPVSSRVVADASSEAREPSAAVHARP